MTDQERPAPTIFVIFGITGDLAWRKLIPALYNLEVDGWMPERFAVLGLGRSEMSDAQLRKRLRDGVDKNSRRGKADKELWQTFQKNLFYLQADAAEQSTFDQLVKKLEAIEKDWGCEANRIFYLSIPPRFFEDTVSRLSKAGLQEPRDRSRVVIEKPFGHDLATARQLNATLTSIFEETQIFRIDHYLGKETVQNIMAFRFGNTLFEPLWNSHYIDHVQITVAESVGVEHRGDYYDQAGAMRDMIQNHLLQVLCLIAMEPPVAFEDPEVRNRKVDVLRAIRAIPADRVDEYAVRGQYGGGWLEGEHVPGYREEGDVDDRSLTETFAALKLHVDNWRWQGVPFYLRTGKRLPAKVSEAVIQFRPVPHQTFPAAALMGSQPNRLLLSIQPHEGIFLRFEVKHPGLTMQLSPVLMQFYYQEAFPNESPEAYETLLLDIMQGETMLFMRADQTEAAWRVLEPVLQAWDESKPYAFPNYQAGTWGPEEADHLIAREGRSWVMPTYLLCKEDIAACRVMTGEHL